jgi:hypothetical protein
VSHDVEVNVSSFACIHAVLVIADFVNDEQQVDKVANCAELLISRVGIGVRHEKFVATLDEEGTFSVSKDVVAIDPGPRLGSCFPVVGIGGSSKGLGESEEVWEVKGFGFCVHYGGGMRDWKRWSGTSSKSGTFIRSAYIALKHKATYG